MITYDEDTGLFVGAYVTPVSDGYITSKWPEKFSRMPFAIVVSVSPLILASEDGGRMLSDWSSLCLKVYGVAANDVTIARLEILRRLRPELF